MIKIKANARLVKAGVCLPTYYLLNLGIKLYCINVYRHCDRGLDRSSA